ncbi:MAG TPA: AAA family ATPase [Caulobacteraceae bacterium]|nr:AAA family ATPase [Caulobacteraceae bacterium]
MASVDRIHVVGGSGSGTTTLGRALAARTGATHLDTDDFYWLRTQPPYTTSRPVADRIALLSEAFDASPRWVLSGSMMGWGEPLLPRIELIVFLYTPPDVRLARVMARERERYGADIDPGGRLHAHHLEFMEYVRGYDRDDFPGRSLKRHRAWLAAASRPVLELDGARAVEEGVAAVLASRPD